MNDASVGLVGLANDMPPVTFSHLTNVYPLAGFAVRLTLPLFGAEVRLRAGEPPPDGDTCAVMFRFAPNSGLTVTEEFGIVNVTGFA